MKHIFGLFMMPFMKGGHKMRLSENENKPSNFLLLRYMHLNPTKCQNQSPFVEIWLLYTSYKTKCVVFQNARSTVSFDQYFT